MPAGVVVPAVEHAQPARAWTWRAELQITQLGLLKDGDTAIYDPERDGSDRSNVVTFLNGLRARAREKGQILHEDVDGEVREVLARPILLHADEWAEYYWVHRLQEDCLRAEPPFRVVHLAVTEQDAEEQRLRNRGR